MVGSQSGRGCGWWSSGRIPVRTDHPFHGVLVRTAAIVFGSGLQATAGGPDSPRSTVTRSLASSSKSAWVLLLTLTDSCDRWRVIALADPTLRIDIFVDVISPDLLRLYLERSAGLRLTVIITDPDLVTHSIICDKAYRFRRFIVDAFPRAVTHPEELRIDTSRIPRPDF